MADLILLGLITFAIIAVASLILLGLTFAIAVASLILLGFTFAIIAVASIFFRSMDDDN